MRDQQPEQLHIQYPRIDVSTPDFPRTHHERHIRTVPELAGDIAQTTQKAVTESIHKASVGKYFGRTAVLFAFAGLGIAVAHNDSATQKVGTGERADEHGTEVCTNGVPVTPGDFTIEINEAYKSVIDATAVIGGKEWTTLRTKQKNTVDLSAQEAATIVIDAFAQKGVTVRFALDLTQEEQGFNPKHAQTGPITRTQLETFVVVLNSIPKSLYTYANIKEIVIQEEVITAKSPERLAKEKRSVVSGAVVEPIEQFSGRISYGTGVVEIRRAALFDIFELTETLWHEVVGHGVFVKLCDPQTDAAWQSINNSAGIPFSYMPVWQRTPEQEALMSAKILVASSYGGTKPHEDVAEVTELFTPNSLGFVYQPLSAGNGTILDEKTALLLDRLNEIEPNIEKFLSFQRLLIAAASVT